MTYNIHPIVVHFPIALLFIYSVIKILPFKRWFPSVAWRDIQRLLLVVGVAGAFVALWTGEIAERLIMPDRNLVEMHALFATISTWVYGALLLGEISAYINTKNYFTSLRDFFVFFERLLCDKFLSVVLAIIGFVAISATGMLGGVLVYGLTADPLAPILLKILNINL